MKHLILGGARSGKSRFAEAQALARLEKQHALAAKEVAPPLYYIATATADDEEMRQRIQHHAQQRSHLWQLVECPIHLADTLLKLENDCHIQGADCPSVILIDCLTLWISNTMHQGCFEQEQRALLLAIKHMQSDILLVSNEVGSGIVPLGNLSRDFVDNAGRLHQALAQSCEQVSLVVAGLPLTLK